MASEIKVDTISEKTSAGGVTIDGVNIKDSALATAGSVPLTTIDIDGGTDIGAAIVDADLFIVDDGAGGTNRKVAASRIKTYAGGSDPASADGDTLGTASLEWSDLYLADGGQILFGNDQEITLTHNADTGLTLNGVMVATTVEPSADTAAGDNAAIGYTSAEGLILTGQGSTDDVTIKNDADTTVLQVATGAANVEITAGNLIMGTSGKGIDFSATADGTTMSSELLDDYEEGTWNPTITDNTNVASGYSIQNGNYIKIGTLVFLSGNVQASNLGSVGSASVGGLPFASKAAGEETYYHGSHHIIATKTDIAETTSLHMGNDVTVIDVYRNITQTGIPHIYDTTTEVDTGTSLRVNMTYVSA